MAAVQQRCSAQRETDFWRCNLLKPFRIGSNPKEIGDMPQKVKPARVLAELTSRPLDQYQGDLERGYWVIPITPTTHTPGATSAPYAPVLVHPTVSEVSWAHLQPTDSAAPPTSRQNSSSRQLTWSRTRLLTLWKRLEAGCKNFGGVEVQAHFLGPTGSREEVRLYCSGSRALLWRGLLDTLHPVSGTGPADRWLKGCGLVWRMVNGTAVLVA